MNQKVQAAYRLYSKLYQEISELEIICITICELSEALAKF